MQPEFLKNIEPDIDNHTHGAALPVRYARTRWTLLFSLLRLIFCLITPSGSWVTRRWGRMQMSKFTSFLARAKATVFGLIIIASAVAAIAFIAPAAQAKDMSHRLGIGYKNQWSTDLPGIAAQYYPGPDIAVSGVLGVDTQKDNSKFGLMAKLHRIIFHENNLHFYMGAGAGLLSNQSGGTTDSGFELLGFGGVEFFFQGLENLGFSFETGFDVASMQSAVRFRTVGDSPLRAGITFYF